MTFEDFDLYTEVDEDGDITIVDTLITVDTIRRDAVSYVYDDKGVAHFGDFEHLVSTTYTAGAGNTSFCDPWAISNTIGTHSSTVIQVYWYRAGTNDTRLYCRDRPLANSDLYTYTDNLSHTAYLTIERSGNGFTIEIYDDAIRTILRDTLTITCSVTTLRYFYGLCGPGDSGSASITHNVFDVDLQEVVPDVGADIFVWIGTANVELARDDTSPVQMWNGAEIVGIKLVATNHADATPIHTWVGTGNKAWKKKV